MWQITGILTLTQRCRHIYILYKAASLKWLTNAHKALANLINSKISPFSVGKKAQGGRDHTKKTVKRW